MTADAKPVARYRPTLRKDGNSRGGYAPMMTTKPDPRDSDWRGEDSRQWVSLADHQQAVDDLRAEVAGWKAQHSRDSGELGSLCKARDDYRRKWADAESSLAACDSDLRAMQERAQCAEALAAAARELQRVNYGNGMCLHLDMIQWAKQYDAALARAGGST